MAEHIDLISFAWGLALGVTFGSWPRETIGALIFRPRRRRDSNCKPLSPAPGMRREYLWNWSQMGECGGPCWEAQDPRCCDCGALWRDVPIKPQPPVTMPTEP